MLLNDFVTMQGYNCILGNVYNAMNYFHVNVSEQDLFFWLSPFNGDRNLPEVFERLYRDKGECNWLEFIKKNLENGHPVIISINPQMLTYVKVKVGDPSMKHYVNIIGIDEEKKQLYVSDSYIPTYIPSTHEGWIDYSQLSDADIGNCWHLKMEVLYYFQNNCGLVDINDFTSESIINRLSAFLGKSRDVQNSSGIRELQTLSKIVKKNIENENYDEIFKLLAGIRLNVINPLIYLVNVFERCPDEYCEWIERLYLLVKSNWEILSIKLMKFALAHKKLDEDTILEQIDEVVELEKDLLNDILKRLLENKNSNLTVISRIFK